MIFRINSVAGEKMNIINNSFVVGLYSGNAKTSIEIAQDLVSSLNYNRYISFDVIYVRRSGGVARVDGYIYQDKRHGMFKVSFVPEGITNVRLYNGEYKVVGG